MAVDYGSAAVAGLADVAEYNRERPAREARNSQAKLMKEKADAQLQAGLPKVQSELEVEQLKLQLESTKAASVRQMTFSAFDRYSLDGNIAHMNQYLTDLKSMEPGLMGDIVRVDKLEDTPEVRAQLGHMGVDSPEAYLSNEKLAGSKLIGTRSDGSLQLVDLNRVYAGTGYTSYMQTKQLEELKLRTAVDQALYGTGDNSMIRRIADEQGISLTEAAAEYYKLKKPKGASGYSSTVERVAQRVLEANPDLSELEALEEANAILTSGSATEREAERLSRENNTSVQDEYAKIRAKESRTGTRKQLDEAKVVRSEIDEAAGGDFLAKPTDPATRRKVGPLITELEQLSGKALTQKDKETARELRALFALGTKAAKDLTSEETGFIDNTLHNVRKYITDSVEGVEADSAYATFRNFARNALMGASLTAGESAEFNKASGTLKQQLGPVLAEMKVQLEDLQSKMQSIYDFNDEHIAQYYLGTSLEQAEQSISEVKKRISYLDRLDSGVVPAVDRQGNSSSAASSTKAPLPDEEANAKLKVIFEARK